MDAENTFKVFDWLWTSGQLSERDIAELPALGIEWVINLALPTSASALPGEAEKVTALGIGYAQIPVLWEAPSAAQFSQFAALLGALSGRRIWLHCGKNMRASAFLYLYRLQILGDSEEQASFPLREVWQPNPVWQALIERVRAGDGEHQG